MTARAASADFHALLREMGELHDRKQADYGAEGDPFANVRSAEEWGLAPSLGACIRIGDKVARLHSFYRRGELANESVEDAYLDLAVYAIIGLLLYREESAREQQGEAENEETPPYLEWSAPEKPAPFDWAKPTGGRPTAEAIHARAERLHKSECAVGCRFPVTVGPWLARAEHELKTELSEPMLRNPLPRPEAHA